MSKWQRHTSTVQGNCTQPNPVSALDLGADEAAGLLPLKDSQCLILVGKPWLEVRTTVWVDNLYLKLSGTRPENVFIRVGTDLLEGAANAMLNQSAFLTNVTFHGHQEHGRSLQSAMAVITNGDHSKVYIDGALYFPEAVRMLGCTAAAARSLRSGKNRTSETPRKL